MSDQKFLSDFFVKKRKHQAPAETKPNKKAKPAEASTSKATPPPKTTSRKTKAKTPVSTQPRQTRSQKNKPTPKASHVDRTKPLSSSPLSSPPPSPPPVAGPSSRPAPSVTQNEIIPSSQSQLDLTLLHTPRKLGSSTTFPSYPKTKTSRSSRAPTIIPETPQHDRLVHLKTPYQTPTKATAPAPTLPLRSFSSLPSALDEESIPSSQSQYIIPPPRPSARQPQPVDEKHDDEKEDEDELLLDSDEVIGTSQSQEDLGNYAAYWSNRSPPKPKESTHARISSASPSFKRPPDFDFLDDFDGEGDTTLMQQSPVRTQTQPISFTQQTGATESDADFDEWAEKSRRARLRELNLLSSPSKDSHYSPSQPASPTKSVSAMPPPLTSQPSPTPSPSKAKPREGSLSPARTRKDSADSQSLGVGVETQSGSYGTIPDDVRAFFNDSGDSGSFPESMRYY